MCCVISIFRTSPLIGTNEKGIVVLMAVKGRAEKLKKLVKNRCIVNKTDAN